MSVNETHFVVWGIKLPKLDYDEYELMFDQYGPKAGNRREPRAENPKNDIALIDADMDGRWNVIGHVQQMAVVSEGEGLSYARLEAVPEKHLEWMNAIYSACKDWGIETPDTFAFGWMVFTRYS